MAFLTVVLPCHGVQAYLRECLDSILGQRFDNIEVIGIDDASPDHSGAILDEYAKRDPRLRVIHLESNVGLGPGRNIGLAEATGEYVMFVDSDDWLADGSLGAIADRLHATQPDVLFYDYARTYWDGRRRRNVLNDLFREPPSPDVFTLRERPSVMHIMMTAWNKAFRREFLLEHGFQFNPGYYEDLVVTYPALMVAERISLLDRVCYYYRQRRAGAITKTAGRKHFAAFDQYQQIFEWMDRTGPSVDEFRASMFERMIWHLLIILSRPDRVQADAREEFYDRLHEFYIRYVPEGFVPPDEDRERFLLVQRGSLRAFLAYEQTQRARAAATRVTRKARRRAGSLAFKGVRRVRVAQYNVRLRRPIDEELAAFACYWYRPPTGNPLGVYSALRELAPNIRPVWVVQQNAVERVPADIDYVVANTAEYYDLLARAKWLVNDVNFPNFVKKRPGSIHLQTQHGTPLKTMGTDLREYPVALKGMNIPALIKRAQRWDYNLSSNRHSTEVWQRTYPGHFETLEYGYPRNDRYYTATADEVRSLRESLGLAPDQTAVLYAPTHREYRSALQPQLDLAHVARSMPDDQILLVRAHYFYNSYPELEDLEREGLIKNVSSHPHTEDLCLAADVLLTDYSSISFDYANLRRPIILYADDYDTYRMLRGTYFDLLEAAPGPVATTEEELIGSLRERTFDDAQSWQRLDRFRERFCEFDDGRAGERTVRKVFLGQEPEPPLPLEQRSPAPPPQQTLQRAG